MHDCTVALKERLGEVTRRCWATVSRAGVAIGASHVGLPGFLGLSSGGAGGLLNLHWKYSRGDAEELRGRLTLFVLFWFGVWDS
jgi:hypothetical protein